MQPLRSPTPLCIDDPHPRVSRLAPSPTGALHLGNARTFLINWALARRHAWQLPLRIEDLDSPRVKPEAAAAALDDLRWLGIDWDGPPTYQSHDLTPYRQALRSLQSRGLIYPCTCTRKEIEQAQSAPHAEDHELRYPGTCRPHPHPSPAPPRSIPDDADPLDSDAAAWRFRVSDAPVTVHDSVVGPRAIHISREVGDFVVATKQGLPAYQLAVVVDDAAQGVTDVVRGDDLLPSAARQMLLYHALGLSPLPRYHHLPLVLGEDGRRLAKRHGDTRLQTLRDADVPPGRVISLLARWSGIPDPPPDMSASHFARLYDPDALPRHPAIMRQPDLAALHS